MHHSHLQGFISTIAFLWLPALRLQATSHLLHKTSQTHQLLSSSDPHPETPSDIVSDIPSGSIYIYAYVYIYIIYIYQENDKNVFGRPNAFADQNALSVYTVEHERH